MGISEILLIAIGLSMDAFAVSVTNGLSCKNIKPLNALLSAACFGAFQGVMPTLGFFLGKSFEELITSFDHIIALILLCFIGIRMIHDSKHSESESSPIKLTFSVIMLQGLATSIDAMAAGISMAAMSNVSIIFSSTLICFTTFILTLAGTLLGKRLGSHFCSKAQILGGLILIGIGVKIFIEHTFL